MFFLQASKESRMRYAALFLLLILTACAPAPLSPVSVTPPARPVSYQDEIKPILDRRCVVCHSCYNSPCQLKLSSFEGLDRGASKKTVYNALRLKTMDPTRLFIDARTTEAWRQKGFTSVTDSDAGAGLNNSLMLQLLQHKMTHPDSRGDYFPEADNLTCAENGSELAGYLDKHPNGGMPFGFPPLAREEFDLVAGWLAQGAPGPSTGEQAALTAPADENQPAIAAWERFFNGDDIKHRVTARYLYEHLFLAHINFRRTGTVFYELVRSRTPPGTPIDLVATVRPYDDPGTERVYYRFRRIHSTIVYKTHMVFTLDAAERDRIEELFIRPPWQEQPHRIGYDPVISANPFAAFAQIPVRSRYRFLLAHSHYIIMSFIRGPVCRGQIALNVIQDHFWVMFLDPDADLSVRFPAFLRQNLDDLRMPIEEGSHFPVIKVIGNPYHRRVQRFFQARQDFYAAHYYNGLGYDAIWTGERDEDSPLLTVYRHFDSASSHRGLLGELPRTMWLIDYPLFERIYYALVAGFDVYGTMGHQLALRLYMDNLRVEAESYFLELMPADRRKQMFQSWYGTVPYAKIHAVQTDMPSAISFGTGNPKREFIETLVRQHLPAGLGIDFDPINYFPGGRTHPPLPEKYTCRADYMQGLRSVSRPGTSFVRLFDSFHANLAYLRVRMPAGREDLVASLVVNRWHDNVTYLFGEKKALDSSRDRIDILPGFIGSYPNYFFDVQVRDLPDFLDLLENMRDSPGDMARLKKYGINRADPRFWPAYDWFQVRFLTDEPVRGGLFDLNRYYFRADFQPVTQQ
jgi:hypothetical protein